MSVRISRRVALIMLAAVLLLTTGGLLYWRAWSRQNAPTYQAKDPVLAKLPLYFYPSGSKARKALLFYFGNDVAFWEPHQAMANRLSKEGFDVVGIDLRKFLASLPDNSVPARDSAYAASIDPLIARVRAELHADSIPLLIGGHSFGAEVALWTAMHRPPPGLKGLLIMSTRGSGHFFVQPSDWANKEPEGPGSFSTIELVRDIPPSIRIALIRGQRDDFQHWDSTFAAVGGARFKRFYVMFTGHSIRKLVLAGPQIDRAMAFLVDSIP